MNHGLGTSSRIGYAGELSLLMFFTNSEQGAKYKFGVDVQSKGFDEAPDAILQAVHRLKWAGRTAVPMAASYIAALGKDGGAIHDANVEFNECLSLGYMKDDRIKVSIWQMRVRVHR